MLFTFSSFNEFRSCPLSLRFHDNDGEGFPLTIQVKSTCWLTAPGIWVLVGVDVEMIGRTVGKQLLQFIQTVRNIFLNVHLSLISSEHHAFSQLCDLWNPGFFLDMKFFSLHARFLTKSKLKALSKARRPTVCKESGRPLAGLLLASVAQSIKLICRQTKNRLLLQHQWRKLVRRLIILLKLDSLVSNTRHC